MYRTSTCIHACSEVMYMYMYVFYIAALTVFYSLPPVEELEVVDTVVVSAFGHPIPLLKRR